MAGSCEWIGQTLLGRRDRFGAFCFARLVLGGLQSLPHFDLLLLEHRQLGLGVRAPTATWGNIIGEANAYIGEWYYWFFPALFIILTVLGINFFGDGLRDALDPKSLR